MHNLKDYATKTHNLEDYATKTHNLEDYATKTHNLEDYATKTHNLEDCATKMVTCVIIGTIRLFVKLRKRDHLLAIGVELWYT